MRLFIAVRCPEAALAALASWQEGLRRIDAAACRWVKPEAMHVTLRFLGEVAAEPAQAAVRLACRNRAAFPLAVRGAGAFPRPEAARVIWAGIDDPEGGLADLAASVERSCVAEGLGRADHPFSPHLTVGRARDRRTSTFAGAIAGAAARPFGEPWTVTQVELIHSTLTPRGPIYRTILTESLATG